MLNSLRPFLLGASLAFLFVSIGCGDDGPGSGATDCNSSASRSELLSNYASAIEDQLAANASSGSNLRDAIGLLKLSRTEDALRSAREALAVARSNFELLGPYALAIQPDAGLYLSINPYPIDTASIERYVRDGNLDVASMDDFDYGFEAIEYLLYRSPGSVDTSIATVLEAMRVNQVRIDLAQAYAADLSAKLSTADRTFRDSGKSAFLAADGTDAGSSLAALVNGLSKHFEDVRRDKVGIPYGAVLGFPSPRLVEARFSNKSLRYLRSSLLAAQQAFALSGNQVSLRQYLSSLNNAEGQSLAEDIDALLLSALANTERIQAPFAEAVRSDRPDVQALYADMSRQVVNFKTDMPSLLCVAITYVDNPSDSD